MSLMKYMSNTGVALCFAMCASTAVAQETIPLPPADMYPEGIGLASNGIAYVGSLARGEIWEIDTNSGAAKPFTVEDADLMSVIGVHASNDGSRVYACSSDPAQRFEGRGTELVAFSSDTGKAVGRHVFPGGGLCNDIAELPDGTILATDSMMPRIMALSPSGEFSEWVRDDAFAAEGFGLNGIVGRGDAVYVGIFATGALFQITTDGAEKRIKEVAMDRPLAGPDGLEVLENGDLLAVEGKAASVSRVTLDETGLKGQVDRLAEGLKVPTTAAIKGGNALVIQGQLDRFFGMNTSPPVPFEIAIIPLG